MARPRKNVGALQGNHTKAEIQQRLEQEKRIYGNCDDIFVPKFIENDEVAVEEYLRITEELKNVNLITNVDTTLLGVYADSYSKFVESTLCMANEPLVIDISTKTGDVSSQPNPYLKVQNQYAQMLLKISSLYGLDPASRSKIAHLQPSDKEEQVDPLMELMKKVKG